VKYSACLTSSGTVVFFSICIGFLSLVYHLLQTWLSWSSSTTPLAPDGGRPLWAGRITGRRGARRTASTVASGSCRPKTRYRHGDDSGPLMSSTEDHCPVCLADKPWLKVLVADLLREKEKVRLISHDRSLHSKLPMYSYGKLSALVWNNSETLLGSEGSFFARDSWCRRLEEEQAATNHVQIYPVFDLTLCCRRILQVYMHHNFRNASQSVQL